MAKNNNRFHVNSKGEVGVCQAKKGICPFEHFNTREEAESHSSKQGESRFGVFGRKKTKKQTPNNNNNESDKPFGRRKRITSSFSELKQTKPKESYFNKIRSISFYKKPLRENVGSYHYEYERRERLDKIFDKIGEGQPIDRFVIDDGRKKPQIQEIHDNGQIIIYDINTHKPITSFVAKKHRIQDIYDRAQVIPPRGLLEKAEYNESKKYNEL